MVDGLLVVWPQNHWDGFSSVWSSKPMVTVLSGLASKPSDGFRRFGLKTGGDSFCRFGLKIYCDNFLWFGLKTSGDGFLQFGLKTGGDGFSQFGLKTGGWFCG
jgi:hypothetical protein